MNEENKNNFTDWQIPGLSKGEMLRRAQKELVDAREVLFQANFEPIVREWEHFKTHRSIVAQPLAFHISQLVEWNQKTQIARDAFRNELASLGYSPERIRALYDAEFKKQKGEKTDDSKT